MKERVSMNADISKKYSFDRKLNEDILSCPPQPLYETSEWTLRAEIVLVIVEHCECLIISDIPAGIDHIICTVRKASWQFRNQSDIPALPLI